MQESPINYREKNSKNLLGEKIICITNYSQIEPVGTEEIAST